MELIQKKDPVIRFFSVFFQISCLFIQTFYVFIYLFIKQQLWMSALATTTISIICYGTIKPKERTILNNL